MFIFTEKPSMQAPALATVLQSNNLVHPKSTKLHHFTLFKKLGIDDLGWLDWTSEGSIVYWLDWSSEGSIIYFLLNFNPTKTQE